MRVISRARNKGPLNVEPIAAPIETACVGLERGEEEVGVMSVSQASVRAPSPHHLALLHHRRPLRRKPTRSTRTARKCQNDIGPIRRQVLSLKQHA